MKRIFLLGSVLMAAMTSLAADVQTSENQVTIRPDGGQAKVIRLEVMNGNIIRVRATSKDALPQKPASLMIVPQTAPAKGSYSITENDDEVIVKAKNVKAVVKKDDGRIKFYDAEGKELLKEVENSKQFTDFTVPEREYGIKGGAPITEEMKHGLTWQMTFDSPEDEAFYGLGQHQSEEFNMKGKNEDLFQYNTKVSIPFVLSNKNYGLDRFGKKLVRDEDSIYYEYGTPEKSQIALKTDNGGIKNFPKEINLMGANVTYEGFIEPECCGKCKGKKQLYQFILYYSGYVTVYIDGEEVVPERWRTAWNPNTYKFSKELAKGKRAQVRIEWRPDGGEAYCGLRVSKPRSKEEREQLTIWSEMAKDMDYYFIAGQNFDEVISGYRTLTGKAALYPKWVLGFWQSRERYKTSGEIEENLAEFRKRHIPIDNIVQDWNYWPEDQWGSHKFEPSRYPDPQAMLDSVHAMHGRFMISVWPKFYVNTDNYKELDAKGWMYVQSPTDDIHDWVGPGYKNGFYDAYDPDARKIDVLSSIEKDFKAMGFADCWRRISEVYDKSNYLNGCVEEIQVDCPWSEIPHIIQRTLLSIGCKGTIITKTVNEDLEPHVGNIDRIKLIEFDDVNDAYEWFAQIKMLPEGTAVINRNNVRLNHTLYTWDRPQLHSTFRDSNPQLLQLFKLSMSIFSRPLNIQNLVSYLMLPMSPIPGALRRRLARLLISQLIQVRNKLRTYSYY